MTAYRLDTGGNAIDRDRTVAFTFDDVCYHGFAGDTLASALLASEAGIVARSIKLHRPRGVWGFWNEEPNAIVDLASGDNFAPNVRATQVPLDGTSHLVARSVNTGANARHDRAAFLDRLARFLPAGFYYKTFMWPGWEAYERSIRRMAGLGQLSRDWRPAHPAEQYHLACDVLVIGAGPAGLSAALAAARKGRDVILLDDRPQPGGSLRHRRATIDGRDGAVWIHETLDALASAGARILSDTTAYGIYDHDAVQAVRRSGPFESPTLIRLRPKRIVLAAGCIERPQVFGNNDLPGIMSAEAALFYLARHGVAAGRTPLLATDHDQAYETAFAYHEAGIPITVLDRRPTSPAVAAARERGIVVHAGTGVATAGGRDAIRAVMTDGRATLPTDALMVSGGLVPTVHLYRQARRPVFWRPDIEAFVPAGTDHRIAVAGAANGTFDLEQVMAEGRRAGDPNAAASGPARPVPSTPPADAAPPLDGTERHRAWVDFQNDVTVADVALAVREGFGAVEHLKRYTTLGMATDQGKTSNINGLLELARLTGKPVAETGTTTFRPPYVPVPLSAFAGSLGGELYAPLRRLALENSHRSLGAVFGEYGGVLRPAFYGREEDKEACVQNEAREARHSVGVFDSSPLGKIEVIGPDAGLFLDFVLCGRVSTLAPGRIRYTAMLAETGIVYDDGVVVRLDENRFIVSCSSAHVASVVTHLEEMRQDMFDPAHLFVHDATEHWATITLTGPRSRVLAEHLNLGVDLGDDALRHMSITEGRFAGAPVRIARVSFTGERSYEMSVPASRATSLFDAIREAGRLFEAVPLGIEAVLLLRAEKGYVIVGKDTDGTTMPHDIGLTGPLEKRTDDFVGRPSLFTEAGVSPARRQLVGLEVELGSEPIPTGAHAIATSDGGGRSIGYVTSSYASPTLGRPVALALVEAGRSRSDAWITIQHLGRRRRARIVAPCSFDPSGERLNA
jgi:sarcosine oxidase subunit alpha